MGESLVPVKGPEGNPDLELNFSQFDDIPIPVNSKLQREESIIISRKIGWSGRLVFETTEDQIEVFDFLETNYQNLDGKKYLKSALKVVYSITKTAKGLLQFKFSKKHLLDQKLK